MLIQLDVLSSQLSLGMIGTSSILLSLTLSLQPQDFTILELELELDFPFGRRPLFLAVEVWIVLVDKSAIVLHLISFYLTSGRACFRSANENLFSFALTYSQPSTISYFRYLLVLASGGWLSGSV